MLQSLLKVKGPENNTQQRDRILPIVILYT